MKTSATCNQTRVIHLLIDSCNVADTVADRLQIKVSATQYKPCKANSPWVQKFIVYINFPFPGGELSFPALEITVSTAGNESF